MRLYKIRCFKKKKKINYLKKNEYHNCTQQIYIPLKTNFKRSIENIIMMLKLILILSADKSIKQK